MSGHLRIVADGDGPRPMVTGAAVLRDVAALIAEQLPNVATDDPYRLALEALLKTGRASR